MNSRLLTTPIEKVRFSYDRNPFESVVAEDDDEDYSASVNAILLRKASSKRRKRRSSSPFSHDEFSAQSTPRRRSSGYTVTSMETSSSKEEPSVIKEDQIYENIRLHKEVITNVKQQPWPIRRKLKLLQKAKAYVKRHEGELQVRLKQSRSTKDILTRFNILIIKKWQHTKREVVNFMNLLIPWELRIKEIESHFGTVVASYFTFLRWLFWVNLVTSVILTAFVIVPEVLLNKNRKNEDDRKELLPNERKITLDMLLNFEGILKHSPIFYGYYSNREETGKYKLPTAYFMIGIGVYIYCFIAILRKMAVNFRLSKLSEKEDECIFTWKLFTGWDYMIGNAETGHNRTSSIVLGFKEALLEEAEKNKEKQNWKVISIRVFVNLNVVWMLIFSAKTVIYVVNKSSDRQENINENDSAMIKWWKQNETTVVMTVIGSIFPFIFELFGLIEKYHPRKTLRIQLGRIMALNLLNLYTLTFALFNQIGDMNKELDWIRKNISNSSVGEVSLFNNSATATVLSKALQQNPFQVISIDESKTGNSIDGFLSQIQNQINPQHSVLPLAESSMFSTENFTAYSRSPNSSCCHWNTPNSRTKASSSIFMLKNFLNRIDAFTDPAKSKYPKPIKENDETAYLIRTQTEDDNAVPYGEGDDEAFENDENKLTTAVSVVNTLTTQVEVEKDFRLTTVATDIQEVTSSPPNNYFDDAASTTRVDHDLNWNGGENSSNTLLVSHNNNGRRGDTVDYDNNGENHTETLFFNFKNHTSFSSTYNATAELMFTTAVDVVVNKTDTDTDTDTDTETETGTEIEMETTVSTSTNLQDIHSSKLTTLAAGVGFIATSSSSSSSSSSFPNESKVKNTSDTLVNLSIVQFDKPSSTSRIMTTSSTTVTCKPTQDLNLDAMQVNDLNDEKTEDMSSKIRMLEAATRQRLRRLCWETMFGQELVKLTIMDLAENIMSTFCGDFIRALLVRYLNKIWYWDLEKKFPKYADFKIAENILHLVNNQGLVWMGMFFSPGLPLINVVKLMIMMYLRSWAVLTCNVPHEVVFRASRSNNFYLALLLTMLFLCVLPVCYAIVWLKPSWHCGPFSNQKKIYIIFVRSLKNTIHPKLHHIMDYMASPGTVIPLIIILLLVIYYLASLTSALREANVDLKVQLRRERTEERKKMFQMASRRKRGGSDMDSTFAKWKKILQDVPSTKLSDETAYPDFLDDKKGEDRDVDNGLLKRNEEEKQKIKNIFRAKHLTESSNEKKWAKLLKNVPKSSSPPQEIPMEKENSSTSFSLKEDSSMRSENIPEIKISRVQTLEQLKSDKLKQPIISKIEEIPESVQEMQSQPLPKFRSVLEKLQRKSNLKDIGKTAKLDSDSEIDDDVFLESVVVVDVPEMPKIADSISNRIKRRLRKVLSIGSNEDQFSVAESSCKNTDIRLSTHGGTFSEESEAEQKASQNREKAIEIHRPTNPNCSLNEKQNRILEYRKSKLIKSESVSMERDTKGKGYMQRRKSSLDEIRLPLPDI